MGRLVPVVGLLGVAGFASTPARAGPAPRETQAASEVSAQANRTPPRLRVTPQGRRLLYRDCEFKLVQQMRPGGPVIVPWQRCWWVRG